jgi:hypothetical protein
MNRVIVALLSALALAGPARRDPVEVIPWAWERREDLRFLGRGHTVAFYAGILTLDGDRVIVEPRRNPLLLPDDTHRIAVIRIETRRATLDERQCDETVAAIARLFRDAEELQIDFDAARSERAFYRILLARLNQRIDARLSITALASWCMEDRWIGDLPIDEAVPMLFRMGPEHFAIGEGFPEPRCRGSAGISVDEPLERLPRARRIWVFNPNPWTESAWKNAASSL